MPARPSDDAVPGRQRRLIRTASLAVQEARVRVTKPRRCHREKAVCARSVRGCHGERRGTVAMPYVSVRSSANGVFSGVRRDVMPRRARRSAFIRPKARVVPAVAHGVPHLQVS